jgi:pimeloyl-ACP methyl ester carboxylesterase
MRVDRLGAPYALALVVWLACSGLSSCFLSPKLVGVQPVNLDEARLEIDTCALNGTRLSPLTHEVLALYDVGGGLSEDPLGMLRALHARTLEQPSRAALFALAETSYWLAKRKNDRDLYLSAAIYAYLYLLDDEGLPPPFDRRFRWAADIYNQGLLRAGSRRDSERYELPLGEHTLPVGKVRITEDRAWLGGQDPVAFLPTDRFRIEGLKLRLRDSGMGVPLIGLGDPAAAARESGQNVRLAQRSTPVTAFLRLHGGLADLTSGLDATLELHSGYDTETVEVLGTRVPLESDRSTVLAHALNDPKFWRFGLSGLFESASQADDNHLILAQPYQRGRVPVVFVHGTASSPAYWADLFNTLWWDPELRAGAQFWFFKYATGNPLIYSAADLRDTLAEAVAKLDPAGNDPALERMVVIGHSQGGLLAHLMVVDGDLDWLEEITGKTVESFGFSPEQLALLGRCLEFDPLPFVSRVVYISTPHRGSFLATKWYSPIFAGLIALPGNVTDIGRRLLKGTEDDPVAVKGLTSLQGMDPGNPLLARLVRAPTAANVQSHSIISIGDADPHDPAAVAKADDGVVEYTSAHLDDTDSEDIVPSPHSCQSHPATIDAVHRILLEHLRAQP